MGMCVLYWITKTLFPPLSLWVLCGVEACIMLHKEAGYATLLFFKYTPWVWYVRWLYPITSKDSVICPIFTPFCVHFFFNIYIKNSLLMHCYTTEIAVHFCLISLWFIAKNQIFINHLHSGYEIIFQVVQLSPSG